MKSKFEVTAIRSKSEYTKYLKKADGLMDLDPAESSPDGKLVKTLTTLIEDYERKQGWEIPSARKLKKESLAVKSNSLKVLKDFSATLNDDFRNR